MTELASPWTFGWEALVAIGTLSLAAATLLLAWLTRSVARASSADIAAQWRPLVVPGRNTEKFVYDAHVRKLAVPIRNDGRGPALFVRVLLDPENISPDNWSLGSLGASDEVTLTFSSLYPKGGPPSSTPSRLSGSRWPPLLIGDRLNRLCDRWPVLQRRTLRRRGSDAAWGRGAAGRTESCRITFATRPDRATSSRPCGVVAGLGRTTVERAQ